MWRTSATTCLLVLGATTATTPVVADEATTPGRGGATAEAQGGNGAIGSQAQRQVIEELGSVLPAGVDPAAPLPDMWYRYRTVVNCDGNNADNNNTELCAIAVNYCPDNGLEENLWHRMYRSIVYRDGRPDGPWEDFGTTCFPDALPGESGPTAPVLTIGQIVEQFHNTPFALPQTAMEPPGGVTLVNLPTFYELDWPEDGVEPEEIDTTTLVGFNVRIRPNFVSATYNFGDGNSSGPVESLGGTWPDGDIQHTYTSKTTVNPSISVVYGGEYSVDGDEWQDIPDTATVDGPSQPLEIVTSRNRLVSENF